MLLRKKRKYSRFLSIGRRPGWLFLAVTASSVYGADVSSTWNGASSNWGVAGNWSNVPSVAQFPNNGNGGFTYDATVASGTPSLNVNIAIEALNMSGGT